MLGNEMCGAGIYLLLTAIFLSSQTSLAAPTVFQNPDYVIIGGGPAGFVLADQLTRDGITRVVLLEAGPDGTNDTLINTPAKYPLIKQYDWNYTTEPNPNLGGRTTELSQGRVFGGGSAINGMAYCRGASSVFDEWAELSGNPGLAWEYIFQDFQETSQYTYQASNYAQVVNVAGFGNGPIAVSRSDSLTSFDEPFASALQSSLGVQEVDLTDGTGIGLDRGLSSIHANTRTRSYAANAIGLAIIGRPNLQLVNYAWVNNIGFSNLTAVNVTYVDTLSNTTNSIGASEIIVSAGAINTPKLLLLSGIGPEQKLSQLGIPVVADIASIGTGLYDHAFAIFEFEVSASVLTFWQLNDNATESALAATEYNDSRAGPLGSNNGFTYATFRLPDSVWDGVNGSHYIDLPADRPHILIEYSAVPFKAESVSAVTVWASLVQPEASGVVTINSSDHRDDPVISSNFYGTEADQRAILYAYKQLRELLRTYQQDLYIEQELYPGPSFNTSNDDQMWLAIQNGTFSFHHPMGTVALGQALDRNWRIKGLQGIRVVDSSSFPAPPSCHTQSSTYALANRAAKDIIALDKATALWKNCGSHSTFSR